MKVELFVGDDVPDVEVAVKDYVGSLSQNAELKVLRLRAGVQESTPGAYSRYAQLLDAATPIKATVEGPSIMGWSFYLRVYWHLDDDPYGPTTMQDFHGFRDGAAFFPALAVRDRMVLVPRAQRSILPPGLPTGAVLDPYLRGDLIAVDFNNADDLQQALGAVTVAVQRELARDARQLRRRFPTVAPDNASLAAELNVHPDELKAALASDSAFAEALDDVVCELEPSTMPIGRWTRARLTVANAHSVGLGRLDIVIAGPVEVRPGGLSVEVAASGSGEVDLSLNPKDPGQYPIEVRFSPPPDSPMHEEETVRNVWLVIED